MEEGIYYIYDEGWLDVGGGTTDISGEVTISTEIV